MTLLAEYALTPDVFDTTSYSNDEVCGLHLQILKDALLHEGLVRNLSNGAWAKIFANSARPWHRHGKELLKKLQTQNRTVLADPIQPTPPQTDAEWCQEALASHASYPLAGIIATQTIANHHQTNAIVRPVNSLTQTPWWIARSPSTRLNRTLTDYNLALTTVLQYANSFMFIDPFIDPTDHQYGDLMKIIENLGKRTPKPLIEIHRASWYPGNDKRPRINDIVNTISPCIEAIAKRSNLSIKIFLWDEIHDRYLITNLIGINLPHGFGTTRAPNTLKTTWTRLSRTDRDSIQRDFDTARQPCYKFTV